jgi:hypothetical protein
MRASLSIVILMLSMMAAHAQCNGTMGTRPTKNGGTMQVCLDDKYSTCIQNNLKGGWSRPEAQARCNKLKARGLVR